MRLGTVTDTELPCLKCDGILSEQRWKWQGGEEATLFCSRCEEDQEHLYKLIYDDLNFCGCGCPEEAYALVRDLLALAPFYDHPAKVRERIGGNEGDDGPYYLVLYVLDHAGLIGHGGSVGGSWLTKKGEHYLELMRRHEFDDFDQKVGYPHEGQNCTPSCRHWQASHEEWEKRRILEGC